MARKGKKKFVQQPSPVADENNSTEEESIDEEMKEIVDGADSDDESKSKKEGDKSTATESKSNNKNTKKNSTAIPFMDTFYLLSSEDSSKDRSIAARDLIHHCFFSDGGINYKDSAYALNRLLNGMCSGRAASRQGFASCLTSFLRVAQGQGEDAFKSILKEHSELKQTDLDNDNPATLIRQLLRSATDFNTEANSSGKNSGSNKKRFAGKVKGIEERDHVFGRLFGILAVVRSGMLKSTLDEVLAAYAGDLIELYHYKKWMKEPSVHALIELLSSIDNGKQITCLTNDVITPKLLLLQKKQKDFAAWLEQLTAEQIALVVHLQQMEGTNYSYPLDQPLLTNAGSIQSLSSALASTSNVVYPRCHIVWNTVWLYLTEASDGQRSLKAGTEYTKAIEGIIQYVVVDKLLGKEEGGPSSTHERRSLALQIVCTLCASSDQEIIIPTTLIESVLCKEVVNTVFLNVLCASGRSGKRKANVDGADDSEHHLKPLTTSSLNELVNRCCECGETERQLTFVKAFLSADPHFDVKTKTDSVASILMMYGAGQKLEEDEMKQRKELWGKYLSFLEEKIVSAESSHIATAHIELMYKLAKYDFTHAPADEARRVVRFFMSAAFFDCSNVVSPSSGKKKKSKKKSPTAELPQELSSGLQINELLKSHNLTSISHYARKVMAARFYSLLSDFFKVLNSQGRRKNDTEFYGKVSRPETIYRALSEICGISTLLESSGAKKFSSNDAGVSDDQMEESRKSMLKVQAIANEALVKECDGKGDAESLRVKSVFATSCASLMMSLYMQLSCCGNPETPDTEDEDDIEDIAEAVHVFIADLADAVASFCELMEGNAKAGDGDEDENPLAAAAGLLVNILSSPVGGEDASNNAVQASASKLTRETLKLFWSSIISTMNALHEKQECMKLLLNEDVMTILIESVCGEDINGADQKDEESIDESDDASSDDGEVDSSVFANANKMEMDLDEVENTISKGSNDEEASSNEIDEDSVELDPTQLENMLLEDSDAEMSDSGPHGVLEHHAGADKALAQLIKLKQEARKASQTERERVELRNQLRCTTLLETLFSASVLKNSWIPIEAVLGSIVPILRYRKALAKSIQSSTSSGQSKKALDEKNAIIDKLSMLLTDRVSKFRCRSVDSDVSEVALKASLEICEEIKRSVNAADCSCSSIALITSVRCIPNSEENEKVKGIYLRLINDWATRKASKIHSCVFEDVIERMPSLASVALINSLSEASQTGHSAFIKCESVRLLAAIFHGCSADETVSEKARRIMKESSSNAAKSLVEALADPSLQKPKHRDEVLHATKHFVNFAKDQKDGVLTDSELSSLQESLSVVEKKCKSKGMKHMCVQMCEVISNDVPRRTDADDKTKRLKSSKTPKSMKKGKTKK